MFLSKDELLQMCLTTINSNLFDARMQTQSGLFTLFSASVKTTYDTSLTITTTPHKEH